MQCSFDSIVCALSETNTILSIPVPLPGNLFQNTSIIKGSFKNKPLQRLPSPDSRYRKIFYSEIITRAKGVSGKTIFLNSFLHS